MRAQGEMYIKTINTIFCTPELKPQWWNIFLYKTAHESYGKDVLRRRRCFLSLQFGALIQQAFPGGSTRDEESLQRDSLYKGIKGAG